MPRHPKLRKKKVGKTVYWFTKAGGDTYFGKVKELAFRDAKKLFNQHLESVLDAQQDRKSRELSAGDLMDLFLDWIEKHRSDRTYSTRKTHCNRFGKFKVKGEKIGDRPARKVRASDLEAWLESLVADGHGAQTRRHAQTSIKHCLNWATKHCPDGSNTPYLLAKGVADAQVAALMGHSGTAMLHKHYSHLTAQSQALREALAQVR